MLFSLGDDEAPVCVVGGKAASLMKLRKQALGGAIAAHVPEGFALSVAFFQPWIEIITAGEVWKVGESMLQSPEAPSICDSLKDLAKTLPLNLAQVEALEKLRRAIDSWPAALAAVRSSAPQEDGTLLSFAGIFETKLGVTSLSLEAAVRECFASAFDHRVFSYAGVHRPKFAAVVMEMVDSYKAGVAFSANPLNSDRDEMLVDSSWGLGESVVDGSIAADRFIWDKVQRQLVHRKIGDKAQERRLLRNGGVETRPVSASRQGESTLSEVELAQVAGLVAAVETVCGVPVDVEWALTQSGQLHLLQARPITTLHPIDPEMLTKPGEKRMLYFDFNIASDATTMSPFTHMDITIYSELNFLTWGMEGIVLPIDPNQLYFNGNTRQYFNFSHMLRLGCKSEQMADYYELLDAHLGAVFRGDECDDDKYKSEQLPPEANWTNTWWLLKKVSLWQMLRCYLKFKWNPAAANLEVRGALAAYRTNLRELEARGLEAGGLEEHLTELCQTLSTAMGIVVGGAWTALGMYKDVDKVRRLGKTEKERHDADALLGGFDGDPVTEINISMYHLARELPAEIWMEYDGKLGELGQRIERNISGQVADLPTVFLDTWKQFMEDFGYDGTDQLFVSAPRYHERPELLLAKIRHHVGDVKDPAQVAKERLERRRAVQEEHLAAAGCCSRRQIRKRNDYLDQVLWLRNMPKQLWSRNCAVMRTAILACEAQLLAAGRLEQAGDIFFLTVQEVDRMLQDPGVDARQMLQHRKTQYLRAKRAKSCPHLIDSRGRILKPNAVASAPGTLVGFPISPGVAEGTVRVMASPSDPFLHGEILVAALTDSSWTPLFVSCSAVILHIGGVLQHGALCAREYGKPAVAGIDVMKELKTGMRVSVDGNTGFVKVLDGGQLQVVPTSLKV